MNTDLAGIGSTATSPESLQGDSIYAPGDARIPKILGKRRKKGRKKRRTPMLRRTLTREMAGKWNSDLKRVVTLKEEGHLDWKLSNDLKLRIKHLNRVPPGEEDSIKESFYNFFLNNGLLLKSINEETNPDDGNLLDAIKQTLADAGLQIKLSLSFGAGVTGFWGPINSLVIDMNPSINSTDVLLIFISLFSFAFIKMESVRDLNEIIQRKGLLEITTEVKKQIKNIVKKITLSFEDLGNVSAYSAAFIPLWDITMKHYLDKEISIKSLYSVLAGFGLSITILAFKNFIRMFFKKEVSIQNEAYFTTFHGAFWVSEYGNALSGKPHKKMAEDYAIKIGEKLNTSDITGWMNSKGFVKVETGDKSIFADIKTPSELTSGQIKWLRKKQDDLMSPNSPIELLNKYGRPLFT